MPTLEQLRQYYLQASTGEKDYIVRQMLSSDPPRVVYGGKAVNIQLPDYLRGATKDWDIYCHDAEQTAYKLEKRLDQAFGGDYFRVQPAKHEGTFKVVSKVTGNAVADISIPSKTISYHTIEGIRYATLDEQVTNIKRILTEPESRFRWPKDREVLQRIELFRKLHPDAEEGKPTYQFTKTKKPSKPPAPGVQKATT